VLVTLAFAGPACERKKAVDTILLGHVASLTGDQASFGTSPRMASGSPSMRSTAGAASRGSGSP
jgi:hypothetical protein